MANESEVKGIKYDSGKLRYGLIPPEAMLALAKVLTYGSKKYTDNSWQNLPDFEQRYTDALMRHLEAHRSGQVIDSVEDGGSGLPHMWHVLCNAAFLVWGQDHGVVNAAKNTITSYSNKNK